MKHLIINKIKLIAIPDWAINNVCVDIVYFFQIV